MGKREASIIVLISEDSVLQKKIELELKELEDKIFQPSMRVEDLKSGLEAYIKMPKGDFSKVFEKTKSQLTIENAQRIGQKIIALLRYA